ncbi:MAG: preprotein translocase subunit SecE [Succinivibrio sp.]
MSETNRNKDAAVKKAAPKKVANAAESNLFISPALSAIFWTVSVLLVVVAIFGNWYYTTYVSIDESSMGRLLRVAIVVVLFALAFISALFTNKGRALLQFGRQSYTELRKVVWPTRQEAVQTTFIVFIAVCVVSLFLYLCDIVFLQLVRFFTL